MPNDVDYRTMLTFLEFYETFVKFVLLKLYASVNMRYPPLMDDALDASATRLHALRCSLRVCVCVSEREGGRESACVRVCVLDKTQDGSPAILTLRPQVRRKEHVVLGTRTMDHG